MANPPGLGYLRDRPDLPKMSPLRARPIAVVGQISRKNRFVNEAMQEESENRLDPMKRRQRLLQIVDAHLVRYAP